MKKIEKMIENETASLEFHKSRLDREVLEIKHFFANAEAWELVEYGTSKLESLKRKAEKVQEIEDRLRLLNCLNDE